MDEEKAKEVSASKDVKSKGMREEPNLRRGAVFITPNNEYYRKKNLGFGWAITHETETELTWGEDVKEELEVCEVCGNLATIAIEQPDGLLLYLCDKCYAEKGVEEEEVWEVCP